ncbi:MAG: hypothetical protein ACLRXQ_03530 [Phascolarctobacterium faecium]
MASLLACTTLCTAGGKYAVIGSDAHYKEHGGRRMREALSLADEAGRSLYILENARCGR